MKYRNTFCGIQEEFRNDKQKIFIASGRTEAMKVAGGIQSLPFLIERMHKRA